MDWRDWDALRTTRRSTVGLGLLCQQAAASGFWLISLPLAALALAGVLLYLQPPQHSAEARILTGPRLGGLIGLRSSVAFSNGAGSIGAAMGQARLIASRDLARRVIKDLELEDNPEFDPVAGGLGLGSRALILFGVVRDPARTGREDRILEAFQERLRVSGPNREGIVTIAFQSGDPDLAANAANRIADLYLDMRAATQQTLPRPAAARIVSRAVSSPHPLYPRDATLLVSGAAMIVIALGAFAAVALPRFALVGRVEELIEQPLALGHVRAFARIKVKERLIPRLTQKSEPRPAAGETVREYPEDGQVMTNIVTRILSLRANTKPGIRIVMAYFQAASTEPCLMLDLARELAREGRSIAIGLDTSGVLDRGRAASTRQHYQAIPGGEPALGDLLAGTASFAEVIRRDPASRLHFLPVGQASELDLHEFETVLDALAEAYDFILIFAPPLDQNDTAKILAAKAGVAVVAIPAGADGAVFAAEQELLESGAREVLLIGLPADAQQSSGRDAA